MYWLVHLEGGPRRVNHTAVKVGDFIYSFGGYCSTEDYRIMNSIDVHVLNTSTLRWFQVPNKRNEHGGPLTYPEVPFQRYGHTSVAYKSKVYMWGGRNDEAGCNILFCFDTQTLRWSKPEVTGSVPGIRDGHSACITGHYMYVFGGFEEEINQFSCEVHCLNLETMEWRFIETTGQPPSYRDFHTATILNNRMYIFGGRGDRHSPYHSQEEIYCPQIVYLDLVTRRWMTPNTTGTVPVGRRSHSAFVYNDLLYIFGGYNGILDQHFNDLYCFDPTALRWSLIKTRGVTPRPRRRQVCLVIGSRLYLFGGTRYDSNKKCPFIRHSINFIILIRFVFLLFCVHSPYEIETRIPNQPLMDYDDTHVLDFEPNLKTLCIMSVIEKNLDQTWLPQEIRYYN